MNIVFVSNYFNHHQRALCDALQELTGGNFCFVETIPMGQERRDLGYGEDSLPEYVLTAYADPQVKQQSLERIRQADAVIAGSAPEAYLKERIRAGKLIFRYAERPLKQGMQWGKYPVRLLRWHLRNPAGKPIYLLAASAYAPGDYSRFGLFRHGAYRWGYFPAVKPYDRLPGKEEHSILWAGRFLDWKHPEAALLAARNLKDAGIPFTLKFIGTGPMEQQLRQMTVTMGLQDRVSFLGPMKPEQVRLHMEQARIFLFTSDRQEGWGAVVNEAMNSGCALVASHAAGSVPYLLKDGENGMIYLSGNTEMLTQKLRQLLEDPQNSARLGHAAYRTIADTWNPRTAARRLLELAENLSRGTAAAWPEGPCSPAETLFDNWFASLGKNR